MSRIVIPITAKAEADADCNLKVTVSAAGLVPCGCVRCPPNGLRVCGCPPRCPDQEFDPVQDLVANIELVFEDDELVEINIVEDPVTT